MSVVQRSLLALLVIFASACSSAPGPNQTVRSSAGSNTITEAELERFAGQPLEQAIQRLRPQFLRTRGPGTITQGAQGVVVYLGTTRMGGVEALNQIRTGDVVSVRYLSPSEATQRFGLDHTGGAIVLTPR